MNIRARLDDLAPMTLVMLFASAVAVLVFMARVWLSWPAAIIVAALDLTLLDFFFTDGRTLARVKVFALKTFDLFPLMLGLLFIHGATILFGWMGHWITIPMVILVIIVDLTVIRNR